MKALKLFATISVAVLFLASCAASVPDKQAPAEISKIDINAQEFGLGDFMSSERTIRTIVIDNVNGAQYELVDGIVKEGSKKSHVGFYRTKVLNGEDTKRATERVQELCSVMVKNANLPAIEKINWYNKETNKVSCLIFKKDNTK